MAAKGLKQGIRTALKNENLGGALERFADSYVDSRTQAYAGVDFPQLQEKIISLKDYSIDHMEELAGQFTKAAEKQGAIVYRASSPQEAKDYIARLAADKGVKTVVKSKSMASEEIHLNEYLEQQGIDVKETDLGEWIIQLAGQRPSHMVMPAIHLTRDEVADIFSKEVEERLTSDIPRLVKVAREELRQFYFTAEMGITGANMAVADTGTIVLVTNEGNARLVATVPPIHVALVGLEKLVTSMEDVPKILQALPRSATAQQLTSYVTMINGPVPTLVDGQEQPKEYHIVLMDNNRTKMQQDPLFKKALRCIRCASCLNVCPVYRLVGGHVFGHVYAGGIGTILTKFFNDAEETPDIQALCIFCGRCQEYCPADIPLPEMILKLRESKAEKDGLSAIEKAIFEGVLAKRERFHSLLKIASKAQRPFAAKGAPYIRHLPLFLAGFTRDRSLPTIADKPLREIVGTKTITGEESRLKGKTVAFYAGCLMDFAYPEIGQDVIEVLNYFGLEVVFPQGQTCCGAPAKYSGAKEATIKMAQQNVEALDQPEYDIIVSACPTCTLVVKDDFVQLLSQDPQWAEAAQRVSAKVRDFTDLVQELAEAENLVLQEPDGTGAKITYHDSCHYNRSLGLKQVPRDVLTGLAGCQLQEMEGSDLCCGMGGSYTVKFPELSIPILEKKLSRIEASDAQVVAMDCPGCLMQIGGGLDGKDSSVQAKHTASIIAEALRKRTNQQAK